MLSVVTWIIYPTGNMLFLKAKPEASLLPVLSCYSSAYVPLQAELKIAMFCFQGCFAGDFFVIPAKISDILKPAGIGRLRDGTTAF